MRYVKINKPHLLYRGIPTREHSYVWLLNLCIAEVLMRYNHCALLYKDKISIQFMCFHPNPMLADDPLAQF